MITLQELWYAWCDIDEHTEAELKYDDDEEFIAFRFGERDKWRRYDKAVVSVFSAIYDNQARVTQHPFDKVSIILKR